MSSQTPGRLLNELRARRIRITAERKVVIAIIENAKGFVDVGTVVEMARRQGVRVDRATIYRTLALLRDNGLLVPAMDGRYATVRPQVPEQSSMYEMEFTCERCGTRQPVVATAHDAIKRELERSVGLEVRAAHVRASGVCRLCAAKLARKRHLKDSA